MKHLLLKFAVLIFALLMGITHYSCRKKEVVRESCGRLIPLGHGAKESNQYLLFCFLGHDGSKCPGCVTINGTLGHIDCQGHGNACQKASCVSLISADNSLSAITLDTFGLTELDFLNMPNRSLSLEVDEGVYTYLNIPAQLVYRDTATLQFTFTGLSFTNRPLY